MRLLLVDDDEQLMEGLASRLSDRRYAIDIATAGEMAWEFISLFTYDLVVLDRMLPDTDGIALCQRLRAKGHNMPVLMLTARGDSNDVVDGLNAGADDYVAKPFDFEQLVARIHALLRRNPEALPPILRWGDLSLDPDTLRVMNGDRPLNLTPKEYAILELLLRNSNHVFTIDAIIDRIWTLDPPADSAVRTHIKCLRQKLKEAGVPKGMIETVYGIGYRLTTPTKPAEFQANAAAIVETTVVNATAETAQKARSEKMAEVMENFKVITRERVAVLERAAATLKTEALSDELQQQASSSAHKLAGSLGTYGFLEGSVLAKEIESYLDSESLSALAAQQQFYADLSALRKVVFESEAPLASANLVPADSSSTAGDRPLLLIVGDDSEHIQSIDMEAAACQLRTAIAQSFPQAKAIVDTDDPAILLFMLSPIPEGSDAQTASVKQFEMLERLHHQAPSLPIVAILPETHTEPKNLTERLDIIRRGARTLLLPPTTPEQVIAAVTQRLKQTGAGAKVLIVDDDACVLQKIQISLAPWGFEISTLENPHKFLTALDTVVPDLLVLDVEMPNVSGLELCQVLRSEPRWNRLPVIFLTVHQDAKTQHQAFAIGADDFIAKQSIGAELANRILNRLARSHVT